MEHDGGVFTRFHDLVQVTDRAFAHRAGHGTVLPDGLFAFNQKTAEQVRGRQFVVAGDGV